MHLVDADRSRRVIRLASGLHPFAVLPLVSVERGHHRAVFGTQLHREAVGVGLEQGAAAACTQFELVLGARPDTGNEEFPDPRAAAHLHRVPSTVPEIERSYDAHPLRVRRPDGEQRPGQPVEPGWMRTELVVDGVVVALAEQVQVEVRQLRREIVGVVLVQLDAIAIPDPESVRRQRAPVWHAALEQPGLVHAPERVCGAIVPEDFDALGVGLDHTHHAGGQVVAPRNLVVAEQRARLGMPRLHQCVDLRSRQLLSGGHSLSLAKTRKMGTFPYFRKEIGECPHFPYITGLMRQMRSAYSRMLRSLENIPMPTVFSTARRTHSSGRR